MITAFNKMLTTTVVFASQCITIYVILETKINNNMYLNMLTELWGSEK